MGNRWNHLKAAILGAPDHSAERQEPQLDAASFGSGKVLSQQDQIFFRSVGMLNGNSSAGPMVTEAIALNLPVVFACVNRISNPISLFPLEIRKPNDKGGSAKVDDHPLSDRLKLRPNPHMSSRTFRKTIQGHALLWGNGYSEIERNGRGQAVGLWPLMPWITSPIYEKGRLKYETQVDGQTVKLDYDDVIHIMDLSQDGYCGQSQIRRGAEALGLAFATELFGSKFFRNDAKSGGFLMHPNQIGEGSLKNIRDSLNNSSGMENAHKVRILEEGMRFVATSIPPEDAQFLATRQFQISEIARIYDVPLIMLQQSEGTTSWGTGIEQLLIGFTKQTLEPWVHAWEQEFNWKLFTEDERNQGLFVKFNMKALLRGDMAARATFYNQLFQVGGISPNRVLELEDEDGIGDEGDEHFIPASMQTLKNAVNPPEPPTSATPGTPAAPGIDQRETP